MFKTIHIECEDPKNTFLTPQELADNLGCPLSRLTGWRKYGGGPAFTKFGKAVGYSVDAINRWSEEHTFQRIGDLPVGAGRRSR